MDFKEPSNIILDERSLKAETRLPRAQVVHKVGCFLWALWIRGALHALRALAVTIDHSPRNPLKLSYVDAASAMRSPSSCSLLDPLLPYLLRDTSLTKPHYGDDQETTTLPRFPAFTKRAGFSHARGHVLNCERLYASQGGNATSRMKGGVMLADMS